MNGFFRALLMAVLLVVVQTPRCRVLHADDARDARLLNAQRSIVKLFGAGVGTLDSYGSGVLISEDGHFVTVWNHLINTGYLTAVTEDGRRFQVKVIKTSATHDLALLQLETSKEESFPCIRLEPLANPGAGDSVLAFSNMFHVATGNEPVSVVHGVVAIKTPLTAQQGRWVFPVKTPVLIIDAITNNSGSAGGLLTTAEGIPAGLIGRELRHGASNTFVNYAVPFETLQPVIAAMLAGETIQQTTAEAAKVTPLSDRQLTTRFGLTMLPNVLERTPAYVDHVVGKSSADQAGFLRGDLVILVDDTVVTSVSSLQQLLAGYRPGQTVAVTVSRQQQLSTLNLRVPVQ